MKWLFILLACFSFTEGIAQSQQVQLQLKKNGKIKKSFYAGTEVVVMNNLKEQVFGTITEMKDNTIFINGEAVPVNMIRKFRLVFTRPHEKINPELLAYATLGVAVSTIGMTLSKWEKFGNAVLISSIIGYSPFVINVTAKKLKRMLFRKEQYRIGHRFDLRVWDIN